jgi:hypothetical protein
MYCDLTKDLLAFNWVYKHKVIWSKKLKKVLIKIEFVQEPFFYNLELYNLLMSNKNFNPTSPYILKT